jgi:iron complex outermembrane receptor protein
VFAALGAAAVPDLRAPAPALPASGGLLGAQATAALLGTVSGPNGDPLPGAVVILRREGAELSQARADVLGNFRFVGLAAGDYTVEVTAAGFESASREVSLGDEPARVSVALRISGISESVVVSERTRIDMMGVPGSVAAVDEEEIASSPAHNLEDVLGFVPGVMANSRFGADESKLSVRGSGLRNNFHHRGLNLLINGIPYTDADGFSDYESIDLMATESIQVWKGANALRYGGNAMGGAINFDTHTGRTTAPFGAWVQGGSFGLFKGQVFGGGVRGDLDAYASFSDTELNGYRAHAEQGRRRLFVNIGVDRGDTAYGVDAMYANVSERLPGALTRAQLEGDPRQAQGVAVADDYGRFYDYVRVGGRAFHAIDESQELSFSAFGSYRTMVHPIFQVLDNSTTTFGGDVVYRWRGELGGMSDRLTIGFAPLIGGTSERRFENVGGESGELLAEFDNEARNWGFWFENELDLTPQVVLITGGRADSAYRSFIDLLPADGDRSDERTYNAFVPKLGLIWQARPSVQVFANASGSHEPPLLLELSSFGEPGFLDLGAQDTWQFELGTRGAWNRWLRWDAALFDAEIDGEIINVNVQPFPFVPFTIPSYRNADKTRHLGLELGKTLLIDRGVLAENGSLAWRTAYTWSRFTYLDDPDFGDNWLPGAPRHVLRSEWRFAHPSGFWIAPELVWSMADYAVDSANTAVNDAWSAWNLRGGHAFDRFELFVHLTNLADTTYAGTVQVDSALRQFYETANGRGGIFGVRWELGR